MTTPLMASLDPAYGDLPNAVTVGDASLGRHELLAAAQATATRLVGAERIAVFAEPSLETVVGMVAGLLAGAAVVPVPADTGPAERAHILSDSGAELWLGRALQDVTLPSAPVTLSGAASPRPLTPPSDGTTALIMYTSGTTGPPKGVLLSHGAIAACLDGLAEAWGWTAEDVLVHGLPLFHVHGLVLGTLGALRVGSPLRHTVRPTPEAYAAANGTLYFGVPTVWSRVAKDAEAAHELRRARLLVSGSAPLPIPVFDQLSSLTGLRPIERYGMSESLITLSTRTDGERRPGWVGTAVGETQTRVVAPDGSPIEADGEGIGELEVRGPSLFDGYLNLPEATAASWTSDRWFRTGDVAAVDSYGMHRIVGRASIDLIKSGGFRIGAGEVENALLNHPAVHEAAVVGEPDADLGQRIVAYVVAEDVEPSSLVDFVAAGLSVHKRPREIRFVAALPRNAMGKVEKKKLLTDG
jgi:fatty acid CoA ligase FadD36